MNKIKKSYYHLRHSEDGKFASTDVIAYIETNKTEKERIKLADEFTDGSFSKYPGFYEIVGPIKTPYIIS